MVETQPALTFCLASGKEVVRAVKVDVIAANMAKSHCPLLWRAEESQRTQETEGGVPVAATTVGTLALSPASTRVMVGKSQYFHQERGHRRNGQWAHMH